MVGVRGSKALIALLVALGALATSPAMPAGPVAHAATPGLRLAVDTTYRLEPGKARVHVVMDVTATNLKADTVSSGIVTTYFWNQLLFGIHQEARSVSATSGGATLATSVKRRDGYRSLTVRIPNLYRAQTRHVRITFDLPAGKPRSTSGIRVGQAFAAFYAWAWGDPGRSSVRVVLPAGFEPTVTGSAQRTTEVGGKTVLTATDILDPGDWYIDVNAARESKLTDERLELANGEVLIIHAWPEDEPWLDRVSDVLRRGLPALEEAIGLDWPVDGDLDITEVYTPLLEGYAGFYDSASDDIVISEDIDDLVIVHEASHAWFDRHFVDERWISEGLANEYASRVLMALALDSADPETVHPTDKAAFPLTTWPDPEKIDDAETRAREDHGYNASWTVMRALVDAVGEDGMRDVFDAIEGRTIAYVGDAAPELTGLDTDWRRFLDLLEGNGADDDIEALFSAWVVLPSDRSVLATRQDVRRRYRALDATAGDWAMPVQLRRAMGEWHFETAVSVLDRLPSMLSARDAFGALKLDLEISSPNDLESAFETADRDADLNAVEALLATRTAAANRLLEARAALAVPRSTLAELGLHGETPDAPYDAARSAFARGDLPAVEAGVASTLALLGGAEAIGIERAQRIGAGVGLVLVILVLLGVWLMRRRRSRRRRLATLAANSAAATVSPMDDQADTPAESLPAEPLPAEPPPGADTD